MNKTEVLVKVLEVACLTEDRSGPEHRAMLDLALELDKERGAFVVSNHYPAPPTLVAHVEATRSLVDNDQPVSLTEQQAKQYDALRARWRRCAQCGWPEGMHYADHRCPNDGDPFMDRLAEWRNEPTERRAQRGLVFPSAVAS